MADIPPTMRALTIAKYGTPDTYGIATIETPKITKPDEVLIKVHYASVNPVDVKLASGIAKSFQKDTFPYTLGYDASGTIAALGTSATTFKIGDPVFTRAPGKGTIAQYCISTTSTTSHLPPSISFREAASIPLAAQTSLQAMRHALTSLSIPSFAGKTVFIPAALSGTGLFAIQLAKNVFGAERVVTTASTGKIARIGEMLGEGVVDLVVDYKKENPVEVIGAGSVDYLYDTIGASLSYLPTLKRRGVITSISTMPSGTDLKKINPTLPWYIVHPLNLLDWYYRWRAGRKGVKYSYFFLSPNASDLDELARWVVEGKIRCVVGREVGLEDLEGVREGCGEVYGGKGGVGKFVIEVA